MTNRIQKLLKNAQDGDSESQLELADSYIDGDEITKDTKEALRWYEAASNNGSAQAQLELAGIYEDGDIVPRDMKKAIELYKKSAKGGCAAAQFSLATFFEEGEYIDKSVSDAIKWYHKAAEQNDEDALNRLGEIYENGVGIKKNINLAVSLYKRSSRLGNLVAKAKLIEMKRDANISNEDIDVLKKQILEGLNHDGKLKYIKKGIYITYSVLIILLFLIIYTIFKIV